MSTAIGIQKEENHMGNVTRREFIKLAVCATCICIVGCSGDSTVAATPGYDAAKLMTDFDHWLKVSGSVVVDLLGADTGAATLDAIRTNYTVIIPQTPWIGGLDAQYRPHHLPNGTSLVPGRK